MGCVPFVPSTGGAGEILPFSELQFASDDEAVAKILEMLRSPDRVQYFRSQLPGLMNQFGPEKFMNQLRESVLEFTSSRKMAR